MTSSLYYPKSLPSLCEVVAPACAGLVVRREENSVAARGPTEWDAHEHFMLASIMVIFIEF